LPVSRGQHTLPRMGEPVVTSDDLSTCWGCGFQTSEKLAICPKCGESLLSRRSARRAGGVLVFLGAFLALGAVWALMNLAPTLMHPGEEIDGSTFTGTPSMARQIVAIIGAVGVFGAGSFCYGLWQLKTGRRNRLAVMALVGLAAMLYVGAWLFQGNG